MRANFREEFQMQDFRFFIRTALIGVIFLLLMAGCAGRGADNPVSLSPDTVIENGLTDAQSRDAQSSSHYLWGYYLISIDGKTLDSEIVPVRNAGSHFNILNYLEKSPCTDCMKISGIIPYLDGTLNATITLKHPFKIANLTGFDVRGIAMFNGSRLFPESGLMASDRTLGDGELINPDGFTTLYNSTTEGMGFGGMQGYIKGKFGTKQYPNALLNGYVRFATETAVNTRNAFLSGQSISKSYLIAKPQAPNLWVFGYVIDASWAPPIKKPVSDPMTDFGPEANCPEAWKINVQDTGPGLTVTGGSTKLLIDIFDRQGKDDANPVKIECPELFDGSIEAVWKSDGTDFTRYEATIENMKNAEAGEYFALIGKEAQENDPTGKPWLDLTAYKLIKIQVSGVPFNPIEIYSSDPNFLSNKIAVDGNYCYVACGFDFFAVFDVSDPKNPVLVKKMDPLQGKALNIAESDGYAYVADYDYLRIIDVDPPESANIINSYANQYLSYSSVVISGDYAYTVGDNTINIVNINPPESAHEEKWVALEQEHGTDIAISGGYAYISDWKYISYEIDGYFEIIDIDPISEAHHVDSFMMYTGANCVDVYDNKAYVGTGGAVAIYDVSVPESAYEVTSVWTQDLVNDVTVSDGYAYLASSKSGFGFDYYSGLYIIDIDPVGEADIINYVFTPSAKGVAVSGGYAYVADEILRLCVIDIDPPESAHMVGSYNPICDAWDVAVSNGYASLACGYGGFQIFDVDPPASSHLTGFIDNGYSDQVEMSGGYAYSSYDDGIYAIDISNPTKPNIVKNIHLPCDYPPENMTVSGNYIYAVGNLNLFFEGLMVIDVSTPNLAKIVNNIFLNYVTDVAVSGGYAYVGNSHSECYIVDVDPPEDMYLVNTFDALDDLCIAASGGYIYGADYVKFAISDVDPPESAQEIYQLKIEQFGDKHQNIAVEGGYAYLACEDSGIKIIDIDPPESAAVINTIPTNDYTYGVAVSGGYLYMADGYAGLRIFKLW